MIKEVGSMTLKVCLFGLSADPPTGYGGHVGIVQTLQRQQKWDEIWVLPVYEHPYSEKRQRLVSFEHRFRMCELAFLHLNHSSASATVTTKVIVSDVEYMSWKNATETMSNDAETNATSVTVGTAVLLDYLQSRHKEYEFYFCLGSDSFIDLIHKKWQQSDRILNELLYINHVDENNNRSGTKTMSHSTSTNATNLDSNKQQHQRLCRRIVVLCRPDGPKTTGTDYDNRKKDNNYDSYLIQLQKIVQEYGVQLISINPNDITNNNEHMEGDRIISTMNVSSTFVRNCTDRSILQNNPTILLPSIYEYIQFHKLYQFSSE